MSLGSHNHPSFDYGILQRAEGIVLSMFLDIKCAWPILLLQFLSMPR